MTDSLFNLLQTTTGWKLQFSGTVDVSQEEQRAILDSGLVVMMVAARTGKAELDFRENGDIGLKLMLRVSDSAMMTGQLRDDAVTYLAHGPDQGHLVFPNYGYTGAEEPDEVPEVGEDLLQSEDEPEELDDLGEAPVSEVLGHIGDYRSGAVPEDSGRSGGPKVGKFDPDMVPGTPAGTQAVGRVYPPGHKGADKVLADFINEEHPRGR